MKFVGFVGNVKLSTQLIAFLFSSVHLGTAHKRLYLLDVNQQCLSNIMLGTHNLCDTKHRRKPLLKRFLFFEQHVQAGCVRRVPELLALKHN